jgi:hypothetical protein
MNLIPTLAGNAATASAAPCRKATPLAVIAYGNGLLLESGGSGTIMTSADDGVIWVQRESGTTNSLGEIAYGNDQFAAFGWGYTARNSRGEISPGDTFSFILTSVITYGNATFMEVVSSRSRVRQTRYSPTRRMCLVGVMDSGRLEAIPAHL